MNNIIPFYSRRERNIAKWAKRKEELDKKHAKVIFLRYRLFPLFVVIGASLIGYLILTGLFSYMDSVAFSSPPQHKQLIAD